MQTTETFWNQMGTYNEVTFPVQIALIILAMVLTYFVFTNTSTRANNLMKAFLSFVFAWNSIVFFLIYAKGPISTFLGAPLFIIVAILFAVDIFTKKIEFRLPDVTWQKYLTIFWILLVFLYPVIGFALGHSYPKTCMPMAPCPLTVFAVALVTAAIPRVDKKVYVALLPWALMGLPKCLGALECYEDCILFGAGVYSLIMLIKNWKAIGKNQRGGMPSMKQWKMYILSCIWGPLLVLQIILVFIFGIFNEAGFDEVMYVGWVIWAISVIFGFLPIFIFKRKGDVAKGKSYVHTKTLVVTSIYSIVRHPQYTAGILFSLALILMAQNWLVLSLGVILIPLLYIDIAMADKHEVEKFGDDYKRYIERVPRTNFILGIIRLLIRRKGERK